jgi:hypothetical protein
MKLRPIVLAGFLASALALSASAFAAPPNSAAIMIHHQLHGCHAWSLNGGPFIVRQSLRLAHDGSLTVTNNDLMAQELVKVAGPAVKMKLVQMGNMNMGTKMQMGQAGPLTMAHMGATVTVRFPKAGTYHFRLIDHGDYFEGTKTIGPDNKPTLTVVVS